MRREMQQLAALMEAAAAGEGWAADGAPPLPDDRVVTQVILGASWNLLPALAPLLLGGAGLVLGGWMAALLVPALFVLAFGRGFAAWSWRWAEQRAARELVAALPRFARSRLTEFEGGAERLGRLRCAAWGIALGAAPDGGPLLLLVTRGRAFRIPLALIRGWGWRGGGAGHVGRPAPGLDAALAEPPDGLIVLLDDPDWPKLRLPCPAPARWVRHLPGAAP